jgi:PAS domain S-box-containing protein
MGTDEARHTLLSNMPASRSDLKLALTVVAVSALVFIIAVPYVGTPLAPIPAFIASYQSAMALSDLITAVLLLSQFAILRSWALLLLACGYLFTAAAAIVHGLTFPGLFAPTGLLGAGPQTTVWLYMIWHGAFPLFVLGYACTANESGAARISWPAGRAIFTSVVAVGVAIIALTWIVTAGHDRLPILLSGGRYTMVFMVVVSSVWCFSLAALAVLWLRRRPSVIDVWLMVVMCAWLFDIALSAILNVARFDLGFYAGRLYGLCAASFVLVVLLAENVALQGQLSRLLGALHRQAASDQQALSREIEERQRIFETSQDLILVTDSVGNFIQVSPSSSAILGIRPDEMIGHSAVDFIHPGDLETARREMRSARRGRQLRSFEVRYLHRDGHAVMLNWMGTWSAPVKRHFFIGRDLTEKQAAEARARQAQKMEAIGQLTGGVAHDFNNLLTVITGTIGILGEAVEKDPELASIAELIDEAADRGAQLTRHLLAFARRQPLQPVEVDVNSLICEAVNLLRPTLGEPVEILPQLAGDIWKALMDAGQLTTAVLNLALNARDAMPNGGKLMLETRNVHLDEDYASMNSEVVPGDYVMISISDTGTGIPAAYLEKVFDPFFTTKEIGKGTGLGLSMVYGFVKQSGGHIKIYSEEGHGTSVKLYLPRSTAEASTATAAVRSSPIEGGHEVILVVEDDQLVRKSVVAQIESIGYTALAAAGASEALDIIDQTAKIDLLFTDTIMPGGMNGRQLVDEALKRRPALKVLYTSGYSEDVVVHQGRLDPGVLLLVKPYRKTELARMIRVALGS